MLGKLQNREGPECLLGADFRGSLGRLAGQTKWGEEWEQVRLGAGDSIMLGNQLQNQKRFTARTFSLHPIPAPPPRLSSSGVSVPARADPALNISLTHSPFSSSTWAAVVALGAFHFSSRPGRMVPALQAAVPDPPAARCPSGQASTHRAQTAL